MSVRYSFCPHHVALRRRADVAEGITRNQRQRGVLSGIEHLHVGRLYDINSSHDVFNRSAFGDDPDGITNLLVAAYGVAGAAALLSFWFGTGAAGSRLTLAAALLGWAAVAPPVEVLGQPGGAALAACRELGAVTAATIMP